MPTKMKIFSSKKGFWKILGVPTFCGQPLFWMVLKISRIGISNWQKRPSAVVFQERRTASTCDIGSSFYACFKYVQNVNWMGHLFSVINIFSTIAQRMFWSYRLPLLKVYVETQLFSQNDCKKLNIENKDVCLSL